jgi:hypothetical protein
MQLFDFGAMGDLWRLIGIGYIIFAAAVGFSQYLLNNRDY